MRVGGIEHRPGALCALGEQHACERKLRRGVLIPRPYAVAVGYATSLGHIQVLVADLLHLLQGVARESAGGHFGMVSRQSAHISREAMTSFAGLVKSIHSNASTSRVLKEPSRRLTAALDRFVSATSVIDEWDRRLQTLGIPVPPADWTPDLGEHEVPDGGRADVGNVNDGGTTEAAEPTGVDDDTA